MSNERNDDQRGRKTKQIPVVLLLLLFPLLLILLLLPFLILILLLVLASIGLIAFNPVVWYQKWVKSILDKMILELKEVNEAQFRI